MSESPNVGVVGLRRAGGGFWNVEFQMEGVEDRDYAILVTIHVDGADGLDLAVAKACTELASRLEHVAQILRGPVDFWGQKQP